MASPRLTPARTRKTGTVNRIFLIGAGFALWTGALAARLYQLQVIHYVEWLARAQHQQQRTIEVAAQRGTIFDRQMHPVAMSLPVDSIFAVPSDLPDPRMSANLLAPSLGLDARDLGERFKTFRSFCWVKRKVSAEAAARVRGLNLRGIYFQKEMKRFYPDGELAAHVLGYVGMDDRGLAGLEYGLDEVIRGQPIRVWVAEDAHRHCFRSFEWQGREGKSVVLTLDENVQFIAEKALAGAVSRWHARSGTVIVQNPHTGEILALAVEPTFNPNRYAKSKPEARINRAIGWVYEPGSTFKLITLAAALEERVASPEEVIDCQEGSIALTGHLIHDHKAFGSLTVEEVLAKSSDVGTIKLGLRLGEERLHRYICRFGFGSPTEVGLPGDERGLLKPPERWSGISIGEISMGQEVGVTPLQLATAYSAIADSGIIIPPRVVREVFRGSEHDALQPVTGQRVVSERTAGLMRQMLAKVVERGTGVAARLNGYSAAGKTGTAQEIDSTGTYSKSSYVSSFVGFAPAENPAITILVVIDSPVGAIYGSEVAAPVFKSIAEQTLGYLNVPQENPSQWPQVASSAPAGFARQKRGNRAGSLQLDFGPPEAAIPSVQLVSTSALDSETTLGAVVLNDGPLITVPDFSGLPVRRVLGACQRLGLDVNIRGSGLAIEQKPMARALVPEGARIWVEFAR